MNKLLIGRTLVVLGFLTGLISWSYTVQHIGDPTYLLIPEFALGATHGWYHAFREAIGDVAKMAVILYIFFSPKKLRTPSNWLICLILMIGYYAPFWVGMPFNSDLSAPNMGAEIVHIIMASLSILGLFISRPVFYRKSDASNS